MAEVIRMRRIMFCYIEVRRRISPHTRGRPRKQKGCFMAFRKSNFTALAMGSAAILISGMMPVQAQNQPAPPPASSVSPASNLDNLPHHDISNGIVTAKVYLPGEGGLYRGTRFDRTGVVAQATYKGHNYGDYWFSSYSPAVHDFIWQNGQ